MVSTINATSASGVVTTADNSTTLALQTNGTNALYIDTSGKVGIGTTSPAYTLDVAPSGTSAQSARLRNGSSITDDNVQLRFWGKGTGSDIWAIGNNCATGGNGANFDFYDLLANANRMRIDSSGNIMVNTMTNWSSGKFVVSANSATNNAMVCQDTSTTYGAGVYFATYVNSTGALAGYVAHTGATTVNFGSVSDYRLKEDVAPITNSLDKICQLKPVSYNWKEDKSYGEGFIAHELQEVIPLAVDGIKDALDKDGNIKPQGVDQSKIVVHLVAAIQELKATVDAQATEIAALRAKVGA